MSSLRLFRSPLFFDVNMWNFSARHKLHLSDPHFRTLFVWTVFQLTVWFILSFFLEPIFSSRVLCCLSIFCCGRMTYAYYTAS